MAQIQSQIPNSNAYGLYLGVKIVDTIANKVEIRQEALELLGAAALWVGMKSHISFGCSIKISKLARVVQISEAKLVEAVQEIEHLVNVSELANARDSLSYMEQQFAEDVILKDLRVSWWLSRRKSQAEKLGWYLCETSLLDLRTGAFQTTEIGASATFLARYLLDRGTSWTEQDERILGVAWRAVEDCSKLMVDIAVNQPHAGILERHQLSVKVVGALKSLRAAF
ncbi:hypothetical protein HK098_003151 [Nowakowskiella sp. JEL0407]|nr:hypothetical protein HK098_003151 [Nowakowskiella sp. JEL0407]